MENDVYKIILSRISRFQNIKNGLALTGVAQLVGHHSAKQRVAGSILDQGTCLGCRFGPRLGSVPEATG